VHGWREGVQDSALTLLMTAAAYGYLRAGSSPAGVRWRWLLVMGIALGAGSLVKSVVAYLVLLPIVLHLAWERRLAALRERAWMLSLVVAAAPWLAWHGAFLEGELGYNIGRRIAGWHTEPHPPSAYVTWLSGGFRPFGIALPAAMALCAVRGLGGSSFDRWLSVWGAGLVLPWLLAHLKHPWYVYPAYPALALGLARLLFPPEAWDGARRWRGATIVRAAGLVLFVAGARVAVLEAWRLVERPERVPLHDAIDWVKSLPAPERVIGVLLDPATVCADERYYLDLAGGSVAYLRDAGELLSMAATEPRLIAVLPGDALPGFVAGLSRLPERSLRVAWSWPRCRRVRGHGRLPTRALVVLGTFRVRPPFPGLPPVTFGEGFGQPESSSRGEFAWAAERASLWFPLAGCGTFHARLHALRPDTLVRLALPGATGVVHAGPEGVDVAWDVEVPPGGATGTVEVPRGCVSPRDLDPSEDDTRCLGVSVANPRVTR
jgi:hypothetical protein